MSLQESTSLEKTGYLQENIRKQLKFSTEWKKTINLYLRLTLRFVISKALAQIAEFVLTVK